MAMEEVREGELHPLQNSNILRGIFKNLKLGDLKSCRLVCREWCRGSSDAMKQVPSVVRIRGEDGRRISDFLALVRVEGEENAFAVPPFMKDFKIFSLEGDSRTFWETCGSNMKSLDLGGVLFESGDIFRQAIFQSCPNLEAISLVGVRVTEVNGEEPNDWIPPRFPPNRNVKCLEICMTTLGGVSWMEMLGQFPSLEEFHAGFGRGSLAGFFGSLALARRHDDQCWKIKDLTFTLEGISDPFSMVGPAFEDLKLPLEKLRVFYIDPVEEVIVLQRFLAVHAPTLKDLNLGGSYLDGSPMMELFHLPNNAVFENVANLSLIHARIPSVSFLRSFPNLKKLDLTCLQTEPEFSQELVGNWRLCSCTELKINIGHLTNEDVRQLLSKLPNLESLHARAPNNDMFRVICELLPKLAHLTVSYCQVDDTTISGLDEEDVVKINEEGENGHWWPITVARPNITGLSNLQRIMMLGESMELGYTTAVCVQKLPSLQEFCLEECGDLHPSLEDLHIQFPWTSQ